MFDTPIVCCGKRLCKHTGQNQVLNDTKPDNPTEQTDGESNAKQYAVEIVTESKKVDKSPRKTPKSTLRQLDGSPVQEKRKKHKRKKKGRSRTSDDTSSPEINEKVAKWVKKYKENGIETLLEVTKLGDTHIIKQILNEKADINEMDPLGQTPLMLAPNSEIVKFMIRQKANIDREGKDNLRAIHSAAALGNTSTVKALIDANADINQKDVREWTPLMWAAIKGKEETVSAIIKFGATPDLCNVDGSTPLIEAAYQGHTKAVAALIDGKADISGKNHSGKNHTGATPLIAAALRKNKDTVKYLLKAKVDPCITDRQGYSALMYCQNEPEITNMLITQILDSTA